MGDSKKNSIMFQQFSSETIQVHPATGPLPQRLLICQCGACQPILRPPPIGSLRADMGHANVHADGAGHRCIWQMACGCMVVVRPRACGCWLVSFVHCTHTSIRTQFPGNVGHINATADRCFVRTRNTCADLFLSFIALECSGVLGDVRR